jgi:hypothetical protein
MAAWLDTPAAQAGIDRNWALDALRGVMLVLMTLTHLPTRLSSPAGQPFGFVSAAEGFVLLSAFMAGMVYTRRERRDGGPAMQEAFYKRAGKIYLCQAALLVFLFGLVALLGLLADQPAVKNLMSFYLERPTTAIVAALLLLYSPPLLDILPMYILFMLASPFLLLWGLRRGWLPIMCVSVGLWLLAQFGFGHWAYEQAMHHARVPVPLEQTGAFHLSAWQFLWVLGLWMGSCHALAGEATEAGRAPPRPHFPAWMVKSALLFAVACMAWRHAIGQSPFPDSPQLNLLFDKWQLGPLRVINLFALMVLLMRFAPWLTTRLPRVRALEKLGAAALPVFCAHLFLVLLALAFLGEATPERATWIDVALLVGSFAILYAVALCSEWIDRHSADVRERYAQRLARRKALRAAASAGALRSPSSTAHSPPG